VTIAIVGVGETDPSFADGRPAAAMALEAIRRALDDAGIRPSDVDGFISEAGTSGASMPIDEIARHLGVRDRTFSASIGIAGSGTVGAPVIAKAAIEAGLADVVVFYYAIDLSGSARNPYSFHANDWAKAAFEMPFGFYGQPVYFAATANRYKHVYGLEPEELGAFAAATRLHAAQTPNALKTDPLSMQQYLASPVIADPLRKPDCCLMNDGGVAYVMTSLERARDLRQKPVVFAGGSIASKGVTQAQYFSQASDLLTTAASLSGPRAFADAGLVPSDVDVAEIYDCFTISAILQLEDVGLAPKGEGAKVAAAGTFAPGGDLPVNTHGGLLSQSYSVGAGHVVEAVRQLRGQRMGAQVHNAEVALVTGLGAPEHATILLTADR
jgi:acetyl-CoA acetyltransferase